MKATTDLNKVKQGQPFTWGEVIRIHTIGEYDIVEFYRWDEKGKADTTDISFHCYLNGKSVSQSWSSLDEALVGLIAYKHEGPNSKAATYFMRMLA